jgi:UDP-N-acetylglucosamine--N-acetylmuramyl-(pentapeptide) pyrophosphoryl-undecaprenol N-acetylglucosamine transferase
MKVLAVGGGSGGHVTPIAAVLQEFRNEYPAAEFEVWCDTSFYQQTVDKIAAIDTSIKIRTLSSGKLRRYYTLPLWKQLLRFRTIVLPNMIDGIKIVSGIFQSYVRLRRNRPDVIFCKGGYVCLPVGIVARWFAIPVVLHDSDVHPGLTNRILSQSARFIGTGAPLENYKYAAEKARYVGVPIDAQFTPITDKEVRLAKQKIGFDGKRPLVVITGGGLGSKVMNTAVVCIIDELLAMCDVLLIAGSGNYDEIKHELNGRDRKRFQIKAFVGADMIDTLRAADIVVARAGATTLLELAGLAKPVIIVPNPYLTGGHQIKNAQMYERAGAAIVVDEIAMVAEPRALLNAISALVLNKSEMMRIGQAIHKLAKPHAARDTARLIAQAVGKK